MLAILLGMNLQAQTTYSLEQCKQLAIENNAKIKKAQLEITSAQQTKSAAYTKYFPQVSASAFGMYAADYLVKMETKGGNLPVYDGNPAHIKTATQFAYMPGTTMELLDNLFVANMTVMQPIYAGGRISAGNELAELAIDINKDKLNIELYNILERTEELYWKLVSLKKKLNTVELYIDFLQNLEKDVNSAFNAGLVDKSDVLKVSLKLSELNINKIQLENGLDMLRRAICQHIGIAYSKEFEPSIEDIDIPPPQSFFQDVHQSVSRRYEMNLLQKAIDAERLQTSIKRGEYLPSVAVGGALMCNNVMDKTSYNAMLLGTVSIPISGWWEASHSLEERKVQEEIAELTKNETAELLELQINQAWNSLNEAFNNIALGSKMVEQAEENFKVVESNYKAGVVGLSDLLEAKAALENAQDKLIEFKTNYKYAIATYMKAIGNYK